MTGSFLFESLTNEVRDYMRQEVELDIQDSVLYESKNFSAVGKAGYSAVLLEAVQGHDNVWLAQQLLGGFRATDDAGKKVRHDAHSFFAGCEFNRFYVRGVCRFALAHTGFAVEIYRARQSSRPRPESEAKIGQQVDPQSVLNDLRQRIGTTPALGMPDINTGLSVRLVPAP